ncbi:MAG: twin-arginine translocase TatA/TatE family subunit [Gemmatimonadales bacterium]|nr:MAG: twin-arginine translocase TatA/TatE family subunit [Gemmatimonadales bacterium]
MFGLGMWEIVLIFMALLLLFGAKRLPEIGSSLGKGIREFKGSLREIETELKLPEEGSDRGERRGPSESRPTDDENNNGDTRRLTTRQ